MQKRQFENGVSESIFCVYACVDIFWSKKGFVLKFSPVIQYVWRSLFLTLSSFKQSIQNLIHISEKCLKKFLLFFVNSVKITDVNCILRIIFKMNGILNNLIGFLDSLSAKVVILLKPVNWFVDWLVSIWWQLWRLMS